ncbi:MAG: histidine--tRNA ligase, partial [Opitutales bacterium]
SLSLRPEGTASTVRAAVQHNLVQSPQRVWYIGPMFRYERPQKGRLRAFYQFNVDIFGEPGPAADAELICLLIQTLQSFGLSDADFKVRLSDRDLWLLMLSSEGLDEDSSAAVLGIVDKLERTERSVTIDKLSAILGEGAELFLKKVECATAICDLDELISFIEELPLEGPGKEVAAKRIEDWVFLIRSIDSAGLGAYLQIDLGIVRGLAYYTGFVFEAFEASGEGRALAGGGRYDALVKKLGGPDFPAVGFAMGDVTLADLLESRDLLPEFVDAPDFVFVLGGAEERNAALIDAATLRAAGYRVSFPLREQSFGKQFKLANQSGSRFALIYGNEELAKNVVKVKDLASGVESELARADLRERLQEVFENGLS